MPDFLTKKWVCFAKCPFCNRQDPPQKTSGYWHAPLRNHRLMDDPTYATVTPAAPRMDADK